MEQSYILQIHTGSFLNAHTDFNQIKEKIDSIIQQKNIQSVIFGWCLDKTMNQSIINYFHTNHIPCYFWLPVLSEMDQIKDSILLTDYTGNQGKNVQVIEDESFTFLCPTQQKNFNNVCELYDQYLSSLNFDGIFLDKIRYPSFANGYAEGFGCFCEHCQNKYNEQDVNISYLKSLFEKHDPILLKGQYDQYGHYLFDDPAVDHFYKIRSEHITHFIEQLANYFHQKNLKVGLDIYAPFFAYHCGQDIYELSKHADFLKPMFYRFTQAPAGMQYEYDAYIQYFYDNKNFQINPTSLESLHMQSKFLKQVTCDVYPGIEINSIEGICDTNVQHFLENKNFFNKYFKTIVCCWNCLLIDEHIKNNL